MKYLIKKNGRPYFIRRVPKALKAYDPRIIIKIALKTDSVEESYKAAIARNDEVKAYWQSLIHTASIHTEDKFKAAVATANLFGFQYYVACDLAKMPLGEILSRYEKGAHNIEAEKRIEAVFGGVEKPQILLSEFWPKFWDYSKDKRMNKSPDQIRKWKNPRIKAMRNFIKCIGNKSARQLTRDDLIKYKDWQIDRIESGQIVSATANKEIIFVKNMVETVSDNLRLQLDISFLFKKLVLSKDDAIRRLPFETGYLCDILLNEENLKGMNKEAKAALYAFAETGAGFSELTGLLPEDIILKHAIPHIVITSRSKQSLKTKYRKRVIPLVGHALDVFKAYPNGFISYLGKPDNLSNAVNKYLRENSLFPSDQHSVYSLRHSFQDRLLAVMAPDRVQADLMGHKFGRQAYGDGASLKQKHEYLLLIQLKRDGLVLFS